MTFGIPTDFPAIPGATSLGPIYRPRALLVMSIPSFGSFGLPQTIEVQVVSAKLQINDQTRADELQVTCDYSALGADPRSFAGATAEFHLGEADELTGLFLPSIDNCMFCGRLSKSSRHGGEGNPSLVEMTFLDYTSFFLLAKHVASKAIPTYADTVLAAWQRLCDGLGSGTGESPVASLRDAVEFRGLNAPGPQLGAAVAPRFAKLGAKFPVDPAADAWGIWQVAVGAIGLLSFFELDKLIVTTASDYYTNDKLPAMVWGQNILSFTEERCNDFVQKGIGLQSFDPLTGKSIEALWPPLGDQSVKRKISAPKKKTSPAQVLKQEARDWFQVPGVTNEDALLSKAKEVYAQRSRQEFKGSITTAEMAVITDFGPPADLLKVRPGDSVAIRLDEIDFNSATILSKPTVEERVEYLVELGYQAQFAFVLAQSFGDLAALRRDFYVRGMNYDLQSSGDDSSFRVEIEYCNKIETDLNTASTKETSRGALEINQSVDNSPNASFAP